MPERSVSDHDRRELHAALEANLGERPATILMELLPPVGYADLLTKAEFRAGMAEVDVKFARLEGKVDRLEGRIDGLEGRIDGLLGKFVLVNIPMMFGTAGLVLAAAKLA